MTLRGLVKASEFTKRFWFSESELIYDQVCLRVRQQRDNTQLLDEDNYFVVDKNYYYVFHGIIVEKLSKESVIEILIEINEQQSFLEWRQTNQQEFTVDIEVFSK